MATTWEAIYLGKTTTMIDPTEGYTDGYGYYHTNQTAENAGLLVGKTYGSATTPLSRSVYNVTTVDTGGALWSDGKPYLEQDNNLRNEYLKTDLNRDGVTEQYGFDAVATYRITLTYSDGTTETRVMNIAQTTTGEMFLVPSPEVTGAAPMPTKPITSMTVNSIYSVSGAPGDTSVGLYANRIADGFVTPDYVVEGTANGDSIGAAYTGDPDGDRIDNKDNLTFTDDDVVQGFGGADTIASGLGNDTVFAGTGADSVNGGVGNDVLYGWGDTLSAADTIAENDTLIGGVGADTAYGGMGDDKLYGDDIAGTDTLGGADYLDGGAGNDSIVGGFGNDTLLGGAGNDTLDGGAGNDVIYGDTTTTNGGVGGADSINGGDGADTIYAGIGNDTVYGGAGNDNITGNVGDDLIYGGDGNDTLQGGGTDSGTQADTIYGDAGADSIDGNLGNDYLDGGADNDNVSGGAGNDTVLGGAGDDSLYGNDGDDRVDGGVGNDFMTGGLGADTLLGGDGNDTLIGSNQPENNTGDVGDVLDGGAGADSIYGGWGNDTITGGVGADTMTGGEGFDTFTTTGSSDTERDVITDFNTGTGQDFHDGIQTNNDFIDLSGFYNATTLAEWNAAHPDQQYANPLEWMRADQADGVLDDPAGLNLQIVGVPGADLTWDNTNVCFTADVMIETDRGMVRAGDLVVGDLVRTRDAGLQPIRWTGSRHYTPAQLEAAPQIRPIRIAAGALGEGVPSADLIVSPQHRVLVRSRIAQKMFGTDEVLVAAKQLVLLDGIDVVDTLEDVTYVHFLFDAHQIVFSNGAETESLFTGAEALKSVGAAAREEIFAIFPELQDRTEAPVPARTLASGRMGRKLAMRHGSNGKPLVM